MDGRASDSGDLKGLINAINGPDGIIEAAFLMSFETSAISEKNLHLHS